MKFILKKYNINIPDDELLADLKELLIIFKNKPWNIGNMQIVRLINLLRTLFQKI